jgi:hypothetical protein
VLDLIKNVSENSDAGNEHVKISVEDVETFCVPGIVELGTEGKNKSG